MKLRCFENSEKSDLLGSFVLKIYESQLGLNQSCMFSIIWRAQLVSWPRPALLKLHVVRSNKCWLVIDEAQIISMMCTFIMITIGSRLIYAHNNIWIATYLC